MRRYRVWDGIAGREIPGRFFFRKSAESLRDAVRFQYILRSMRDDTPELNKDPDFWVTVERL